jgi:hypothetical protein
MRRARVNVALSLVLAAGCGGGGSNEQGGSGANGDGSGGTNSAGGAAGTTSGPIFNGGDGGDLGGDNTAEHNIVSMRIEPADAVLDVALGGSIDQAFTAHAVFEDAPGEEVDITRQTVFYVPDNYLVASFPADGENTLTTRLPASESDPPQRGGWLTVQAQAANKDGTIATATAPVLVRLAGNRLATPNTPFASPALPENPASLFTGDAAPARAPQLVYPNDGVLLPPNLGRLEVHFLPGAAENSLFELRFQSEVTDVVYYTRCYANVNDFVAGSCTYFLEADELELLASSNQGRGPVTLSLRASDEAGTFGQSASFTIEFAEERMDGAVYYWTASSPPSIMRFDFGSAAAAPERFVGASDVTNAGATCVGCHALSRQGDKAIFGMGGPPSARLVYIDDLSRPMSESAFFTYAGPTNDPNAMLNGSFNPDGTEFVAVAPVPGEDADARLFFHSGVSGERLGQLALPVVPNNPDWSPDGNKIAFSVLGGAQQFRIQFLGGGISYIQRENTAWNAAPVTLVPAASGKNRFNPTFLPDGELLLYSEVDDTSYTAEDASACGATEVLNGGPGRFCDGYSDPGAKTWAVAATPGATPVFLANAAAAGVADALQASAPQSTVATGDLMDTFPKPSPFQISHRGNTLGWFTVGSQRRAGLRKVFPNSSVVADPASQALLWMFALDADRVKTGEDGSYPGFFLPFQDLKTSNHMAQWTERIVSDAPPPPAPPAPPPPPPPTILR